MGNKNRRLYKRIIALLLVVLLILPNVISSVVTKAEGEGVSWDGTTLKVTYPSGSVLDDAVSAVASFNGNSVDSVSGTIDSFDMSAYKVREGTSFTVTAYGSPDPETGVAPEIATMTSSCDSKNFTVGHDDVTGSNDSTAKTITISTSDSAIYLTDYATGAKAFKGATCIGSVDFTDGTTSVVLDYSADTTVGKNIKLVYYSGEDAISGGDEEFVVDWKAGDFVATWNENGPSVSIAASPTNTTGTVDDLGGTFIVKCNGSQIDTFTGSSKDLSGKALNQNDVLSVELQGDTSGVLSENSYTVLTNNYYSITVNVSGDSGTLTLYDGKGNAITGENGVYKILKSNPDALDGVTMVTSRNILFNKIEIASEDKTSSAVFNNDGTSTYTIGKIESDVSLNVVLLQGSKVFDNLVTEVYAEVSYTLNILDMPAYISGTFNISNYSDYSYDASSKSLIVHDNDGTLYDGRKINAKYSVGTYNLATKEITVKINNDLQTVLNNAELSAANPGDASEFKCSTTGGAEFVVNKPAKVSLDFSGTSYTQWKIMGETEWTDIVNNKVEIVDPNGGSEGSVSIKMRAKNNNKSGGGTITILLDETAPNIVKTSETEENITYKADGEVKDYDDFIAPAKTLKQVIAKIEDPIATGVNKVSGLDKYEYRLVLGENDYKINGNTISGSGTSDEMNVELKSDTTPIYDDNVSLFFTLYDKAGNSRNRTIKVGKLLQLGVSDPDYDGEKEYEKEGGTKEYFLNGGDKVIFTVEGEDGLEKKTDISSDDGIVLELDGKILDVDEYSLSCESGEGLVSSKYSVSYTIPSETGFDGSHKIKVKVKDTAGNEAESNVAEFIVDNTAPVIKYNKLITEGKGIVNSSNTKDKSIKLFDSITEKYEHEYSAKISEARGEKNENISGGDEMKKLLEALNAGKYKDASIAEGRYNISYTVTDKAGNSTTETTGSFLYDVTLPSVNGFTITPVSANGQDNAGYDDYQVFDSSQVKVIIKTKDLIAGLKSVDDGGVDLQTEDVDKYGERSNISYDKNAFTGDKYEGQYTYIVNANYRGKISVILKDEAGNITTKEIVNENGKTGMVADNSSANVEVTTPNADKKDNDRVEYYNASDTALVKVVATDDISGLKTIKLSNVATDSKNNTIVDIGTTYDKDYPSQKGKITEKETINATYSKDGAYEVKAVVVDNAGNSFEAQSNKFIIDTVNPKISVSYSSNERYNNNTVTATISIDEKNLDTDKSTITVYRSDSEQGNATVYGNPTSAYDGATVSFEQDGHYYIKVHAVDYAENTDDYDGYSALGYYITIDKTSPRLNLTFNNNDVRNGKYYKAERIGTLTVEEHNFDASKVNVSVRVSDSAAGVGTPTNSGFSTSGDTHTSSIPFKQDATYEITVTAQDQAGNSADRTITESFVVDLTAPEIKISNVEQNKLYSGTVRPDIEVTDRNYEAKGTKITLESSRDGGAAAKSLAESYSTTSVANGERFTYTNFKKEEDKDDYYSVKAVAEDLAGNTSEETVGFMVDRFGSYYTLNGYTEGLVKAVYTNLEGDDEIVIEAHNLADIDESTVYFTVGEDTKTLKENEGYTVSEDKGSDHWNVSTYTFDKSLFDAEGEYNIVVSTKDSEGNVADNETKDAPVKFVIDRTAPEFIISGIEDGHDYEDQKSVSGNIEIHDNIGVSKAVITLDGEAQTYEAKDLEAMNNTVPVEFTKGAHSIEVKVVDLAGNESADDKGINFTVDQSAIERAAWWIFIVIGVIVVGGIVFFVVRRRNNA